MNSSLEGSSDPATTIDMVEGERKGELALEVRGVFFFVVEGGRPDSWCEVSVAQFVALCVAE